MAQNGPKLKHLKMVLYQLGESRILCRFLLILNLEIMSCLLDGMPKQLHKFGPLVQIWFWNFPNNLYIFGIGNYSVNDCKSPLSFDNTDIAVAFISNL